MSCPKLLISLSLLALMAVPALAQGQTSQTPASQTASAQPQATQQQAPANDQTTKPQTGVLVLLQTLSLELLHRIKRQLQEYLPTHHLSQAAPKSWILSERD